MHTTANLIFAVRKGAIHRVSIHNKTSAIGHPIGDNAVNRVAPNCRLDFVVALEYVTVRLHITKLVPRHADLVCSNRCEVPLFTPEDCSRLIPFTTRLSQLEVTIHPVLTHI